MSLTHPWKHCSVSDGAMLCDVLFPLKIDILFSLPFEIDKLMHMCCCIDILYYHKADDDDYY